MESTTTTASEAATDPGWYGRIAAGWKAAKEANPELTKRAYCKRTFLSASTLNTAIRKAEEGRPGGRLPNGDLPGQTNWLDSLNGEEVAL